MYPTLRCALVCLALGPLLACSTVESEPEPAARPPVAAAPALPWTQDFQDAAVLLAREVQVTGPDGLREHVAITQDPRDWEITVATTTEGLVQVARLRPESSSLVESARPPLRVQLDNLMIAVTHGIRVVERPTHAVDVVVQAQGDVLWKDLAGNERRDETLTLVGRRPGP